ncbi:hypothetical protein EQG49_00100 [Periweissella cryptocerci]|uniref:Uncharacterized protein n=1 Tax=Periweissella cryptocerci TaxID=2506420 RepID=A0A4V1AIB8_9LACO|nr:hypothetical protein [Periweissella cryptocerci]QBO34955.1 hypothetical protein EQG49_00100 [Periweissella cryptocerci]
MRLVLNDKNYGSQVPKRLLIYVDEKVVIKKNISKREIFELSADSFRIEISNGSTTLVGYLLYILFVIVGFFTEDSSGFGRLLYVDVADVSSRSEIVEITYDASKSEKIYSALDNSAVINISEYATRKRIHIYECLFLIPLFILSVLADYGLWVSAPGRKMWILVIVIMLPFEICIHSILIFRIVRATKKIKVD